MKKTTIFFLLGGLVFFGVRSAFSEPIRPVGPADITGTISEVRWIPEKTVMDLDQTLLGSGAQKRTSLTPITLIAYPGHPE